MMTTTTTAARLGIPNKNNRIYTAEAMRKALAEWNGKGGIPVRQVTVPVTYGYDLKDVKGTAQVYLNDDDTEVKADITLLEPHADLLRDHIGTTMVARTSGTCMIDENGVISDYKLDSIMLVKAEDAA